MDIRYETWEILADAVEVSTAAADVWTCFDDAGDVA
jgi:hypothetical protein